MVDPTRKMNSAVPLRDFYEFDYQTETWSVVRVHDSSVIPPARGYAVCYHTFYQRYLDSTLFHFNFILLYIDNEL